MIILSIMQAHKAGFLGHISQT